ncbi:hypothetical protein DL96DRAFT_1603257 [Flagelloscypha sp. PMI_526]|nr:hypothetical protein DL96DRAFT_1603257 [Flagelloscypha sp. PMI_526]
MSGGFDLSSSSYPAQYFSNDHAMSLSPASASSIEPPSAKKRRTSSAGHSVPTAHAPQDSAPVHIPKRGYCRKGKNRCEGEAPCRRCQISGTACVFEKPEKKNTVPGASVERLSRLEGQYLVLQSQMIGMQSSLDRILSAVQQNQSSPSNGVARDPREDEYDSKQLNGMLSDKPKAFPPLPGFAPPPHKYARYGIIPSTAPSSDDESEDTLPRASLNAPIEALQGLANAAAEAAAASETGSRVKKQKRAEPIPRNAFPHVVEKGLVSDSEARELYNIFFAGCHLFIPLFDPLYDTYESMMERSPWTFDAILAVAGKIRSGNSPLSPTFYKCLEEAQGIARSSLFGPIVRKEAVQGMLLLAAWSTNGWLPSGHAMRMALDLGLHRALEKLADDSGAGKQRTDAEERDLGTLLFINWLCLYWFDHQMSLGTGRPIVLRDETSIRHCRILLNHRMASPTDVRLVAQVELIGQKSILRTLLEQTMDENSLLRKILAGDAAYAKVWLVCVALRGVSWDKMPFEQRELAFQAKDAAQNCLHIFLSSQEYRAALRYAVHDSLVTAAFSGLFLLKMANLFPSELDLAAITGQVEQLAHLLSDVAAERYALTLRIMLANLRRKVGLGSGMQSPVPTMPPPSLADGVLISPTALVDPSLPAPFTMEELGFAWPTTNGGGLVSPNAIPLWLREQSLNDLGLPSSMDHIFLQMQGNSGWQGDFPSMPQAW